MGIMEKKKGRRAFMIIATILAIVFALVGAALAVYAFCFDPYRGTLNGREFPQTLALDEMLTREEAQEDLDFVYEKMCERHPAWLDGSQEKCDAVKAQYEAESAALGESVSVLEVWQACSRITTVMLDGHTYTVTKGGENRYIDDFTYLRENTITQINGEDTTAIFERFKLLYPCETEEHATAVFSSNVIINESYLRWMGVDVSEGVTFTYEKEDGESFEVKHQLVDISLVKGYEQSEDDGSFVRWEIDSEHSIGLLTLEECIVNDVYLRTLEEFFAAVNEAQCKAVVVDLRGNGGGNSLVGDTFLRYIDVESYKSWDSAIRAGDQLFWNKDVTLKNRKHANAYTGDVYILTDVKSYSAAKDFAMMVGDNGIGTIVGEASGNMPDTYGDSLYFATPNARVFLSVSYKKWCRIDQTKSGQPLTPHVECDPKLAYEKVCELVSAE